MHDFEPQGGWRWVNGVPLQGPLTSYTVTNTIDTDNLIGVDNIDHLHCRAFNFAI